MVHRDLMGFIITIIFGSVLWVGWPWTMMDGMTMNHIVSIDHGSDDDKIYPQAACMYFS